jgi:hypothetical protein
MAMNLTLRKAFLYIFASVGLVLCIIGLVSLLNLGLRTYVFTKSDYPCYNNKRMISDVEKTQGMTQAQIDQQAADENRICEEQKVSEKQRSASNAIAMLLVGIPLYLYNWNTIRRDKEI